jgi:serine/threonine protein kinase/tetratricopeptide (TPR) repeat protein
VLRLPQDIAVNAAFGRYRLLERLGQGGMAEVFKAKSYGVEGFEKVLVIKRILPELACRPDFVEMFVHEAKLAVRLSHANIVQVFDLGRTSSVGDGSGGAAPDAYYMAMEYVHGLDLASVLARCRRQQIALPVPMGVYIASEIAKGLDHAHRRRDEQMRPLGIVHRDVSPQNVLLSYEGEVKVTDFGIAKARGALENVPEETRARQLQGKFGYMSPEQARGESVDARSDLFSLGTIVYECVAGVNPFSAPTTFETLRRVQACEYPPIELLRPDAPAELGGIIKMAMGREPGQRYADAGRMYEALLAFLYAQNSRYGAHDLAEFLSRFRDTREGGSVSGTPPPPMLEAEARNPRTERTPVEVPASRQASSVRVSKGVRFVAIDRAVEMGERREVTGLVIELPRESSDAVADRAAAIVERWGGRVLRREGEHLAAIFGLGDPDGRDTEMATRCALVALRSLGDPRPAGAGIHTGRIHVTSAGDATEDARLSRLLDTARDLARVRDGYAAMSAQAMRQVKAHFEFESMVDSDRAVPDVSAVLVKDVRGPGEAFGRFVGRKEELRRIGELLALATKRTARVLTIRGDHGVGKTRLLYEVERRLRKGGYNVGFHIAACPPRGDEFPLSGLACMLHVLCGTTEGDAPDRLLAVQPRLRALGLQGEEVNAVLTWLGASVPSPSGNAKVLLRQALTRMVQSLCEDRPHTFAWDVAHAMDEDSFGLLDEVLQRLKQARVVFAFAARAGFSHPLEGFDGHVALDLGDLAQPDVERLVATRLGVEAVPEELLRFVRARAGGHPLFVEEVIKALVDAGAVGVGERRVVSMKLVGQDLALPKTLRGLVASRVSRLSSEDRATLQAAAVLGDPIDATVLSNMLGQAMPSLEKSIATLANRDFVVHTGPSELRFASPIIPEIVADALTPEAAREMHAAAGQALETTLGERALEHAGRIAGHLYESGDRERAAVYFARSGERRLETRQFEAAARDYGRAIALADIALRTPEEVAMWLEKLAEAVRLVRASPEAMELCDRVVDRVDAGGAREVRVRARVATGHLLASVQQIEAARQRLAEAEAIAEGNEELSKLVLLASAELATRQGDYTRALRMFDALHRIVRAMSDVQEKHRVALHLAHSHAGIGDRLTALMHLAEAEHLLPDDRTAAFERTRARALVDYYTHDFRSAVAHWERAIDMARDIGLTYQVMASLHNMGDVLLQLEDLPRAYGALRQSLALSEESGFERLANLNRMFLAFLDGIRATVDGEKLLRQGIAYAESKDFTNDVVSGRMLLAKLLHRLGLIDAAREEYAKTRSVAIRAGHRLVVDECEVALAKLAGEGARAAERASTGPRPDTAE